MVRAQLRIRRVMEQFQVADLLLQEDNECVLIFHDTIVEWLPE